MSQTSQTGARDKILGAIRTGLGSPPGLPQDIAAEAAALLADADLIRPALGSKDLVETFAEHFVTQKLGARATEWRDRMRGHKPDEDRREATT